MRNLHLIAAGLAFSSTFMVARDIAPAVALVQTVVTVEGRHGKEAPQLKEGDVVVLQGKERLPVTKIVASERGGAPLELVILIDEASGTSLATQFGDLRQFMTMQPPETSIAIGYMRNGIVDMVQNLTTDHELAGKALRLPVGFGGAMPSPFLSLSDLLKRWPTSPARHEVLLISSGIDPLGGGITDPYLDTAIEHAQRAGVIVYAIYAPAAGHGGHSYWRMQWGQNHLAQIAEETGGECYMLGFGPPVSFQPYLADMTSHFQHQYVVTFLAKPSNKAGLQSVRFVTEVPDAEIVAASRVYVPAAH